MPIVIQMAWYFPLVADGKNSLIYVLATIVVAPMPKLVRNLKTPSISGLQAREERREKEEKKVTTRIKPFFLPNRSENHPPAEAPINIPK
jgi:hypothetical protein